MTELYFKKQIEIDAPNLGQVGDVVSSMLTEAQFQALRDTNWVLMDGKSVAGSTYETITGSSTVPDARGQFLRGLNNGRADGQENPDNTTLGSQQSEATKPNGLATNTTGAHTHSTSSGAASFVLQVGGSAVNNNPSSTGSAGAHSHTLTGDNETRPKNITVNYFVKID